MLQAFAVLFLFASATIIFIVNKIKNKQITIVKSVEKRKKMCYIIMWIVRL